MIQFDNGWIISSSANVREKVYDLLFLAAKVRRVRTFFLELHLFIPLNIKWCLEFDFDKIVPMWVIHVCDKQLSWTLKIENLLKIGNSSIWHACRISEHRANCQMQWNIRFRAKQNQTTNYFRIIAISNHFWQPITFKYGIFWTLITLWVFT